MRRWRDASHQFFNFQNVFPLLWVFDAQRLSRAVGRVIPTQHDLPHHTHTHTHTRMHSRKNIFHFNIIFKNWLFLTYRHLLTRVLIQPPSIIYFFPHLVFPLLPLPQRMIVWDSLEGGHEPMTGNPGLHTRSGCNSSVISLPAPFHHAWEYLMNYTKLVFH